MKEKLTKIAADLREAKRYCRHQPDPAKGYYHANIGEAVRQVDGCVEALYQFVAWGDPTPEAILDIERLRLNLAVGARCALVVPDVFAGYIEGAAFELDAIAGG